IFDGVPHEPLPQFANIEERESFRFRRRKRGGKFLVHRCVLNRAAHEASTSWVLNRAGWNLLGRLLIVLLIVVAATRPPRTRRRGTQNLLSRMPAEGTTNRPSSTPCCYTRGMAFTFSRHRRERKRAS